MKKLLVLFEVREAYNQSGFWALFKAIYKTDNKRIKVILWLLTLSSALTFIVSLCNRENNILLSLFALSFFSYAIAINIIIKYLFEGYYKEYPDLIKTYKKNRVFLRYLIFKSHLKADLIGNIQAINEIQDLLETENKLSDSSILIKHPITIMCLGLITAIIGGAASIPSAWSSGVMPILLIIIIFFLFLGLQLVEIIQGKSYKDKELKQFLVWLSLEKL